MRRRRKADPLTVLNAAWRAGEVTEKDYQARFAEINHGHGKCCDECRQGQAVYKHAGRNLCGDCALKELGWTEQS
jgi:hypothetical protein